jgi:hypothetical protein
MRSSSRSAAAPRHKLRLSSADAHRRAPAADYHPTSRWRWPLPTTLAMPLPARPTPSANGYESRPARGGSWSLPGPCPRPWTYPSLRPRAPRCQRETSASGRTRTSGHRPPSGGRRRGPDHPAPARRRQPRPAAARSRHRPGQRVADHRSGRTRPGAPASIGLPARIARSRTVTITAGGFRQPPQKIPQVRIQGGPHEFPRTRRHSAAYPGTPAK